MKHAIEIDTADALLLVQLLHDNYFEDVVDKAIAERLRNKITEEIGRNLHDAVIKELPDAIDRELGLLR